MIDVRNILGRQTPVSKDDSAPDVSEIQQSSLAPKWSPLLGRTVGLVVTDDSIQMAAVRHLGFHRTVLDARETPIPEDLVEAEDREQFIERALGGYLDQYGGWRPRVCLSVSGKETAFRTFFMPLLKKQDLGAAVRIEAAKQLPFPAADCTTGYRLVMKIKAGDQERVRVALHAATARLINAAVLPFDKLRIPVQAIHHTHDVIGRLLPSLPDFDPSRAYTLVYIGEHGSEVAFYRGATLEFFHQSSAGTAMFGPTDNVDPNQIEFFAETLAGEIQTSFDYYTGQHAAPNAPVVLLYGRLVEHPKFIEELNDRLGMACLKFPVDSLRQVKHVNEHLSSGTAALLPVVATALNRSSLANLLPEERQLFWRNKRIDSIGRIAAVLTFVMLIGGWLLLNRDLQVAAESNLAVQRQINTLKGAEAYHAYNQMRSQIAATTSYIEKAAKEPTYLALNLKEMSHLIPPGLRLTQFDFEADKGIENLRVAGRVTSSSIPPEVVLAEFVERLNASAFYDQVRVERHVKRKINGRFQIEFQLAMRGIA